MRSRPLLAVLVAVSAASVAVSAAPPVTLAAPAGCVAATNGIVLACDHSFGTKRPLGAIGLLGDSVLLGSSPGMSTPSLPDQLATRGWGPIRMTTTLGMRTYNPSNTNASAYHVLAKWRAAGFTPRIVVVNLGANHFTDCTSATVNTCIARVNQLMDRIQSLYPAATVWWAKTNARSLITGGFQPGMLGWNLALDRVAAARPTKLVVWDWPTALVANRITTDPSQIHPSNGAQYAIRSRLVADDVTSRMPTIRGTGPVVANPDNANAPLAFTPSSPTNLLDNAALPAGQGRKVTVASGAAAVAVTVTVQNPAAAGYLSVTPTCGGQLGTRLYFAAGQQRSAQAVVALSADEFCITSNRATNVVVTLQGTFSTTGTDLFTPVATSWTPLGAAPITVPGAATGVDAVAASLVVDASARTTGGTVTLWDCVTGPATGTVHLSYAAREVTSAQVFAPVDPATGQLCAQVTTAGTAPSMSVRVTGHFSPTGQLKYRPVTVTRVLEMGPKYRVGEWSGRLFAGQGIGLGTPASARAATFVVTSYESTTRGAVSVWRRGQPRPTPYQGLFYFPAGTQLAASSLTVGVTPGSFAAGGGVIVGDVGAAAVQRLAVDVVGWWVLP